MKREDSRWVLAFDASCGTCRQISAAVAGASNGKLEVLPLTNKAVERWRAQAFKTEAPWEPTLLRVTGEDVQAWIGAKLVLRLTRRLGPAASTRVLKSLGQLKREADGHPLDRLDSKTVGRKAFLRLGAGAAVAAGMVIAGKAPAFAERSRDAAQAWVEANKGRLPQTYGAMAEYPMAYRRAIYVELSPRAKSRFWLEHMNRYRAAHPSMTAGQRTMLQSATDVATKASTFDGVETEAKARTLAQLKDSAIREFGTQEAVLLFATLGPSGLPTAQNAFSPEGGGCVCNQEDDWCGVAYHCRQDSCQQSSSGCGWWGGQKCNGNCFD